MRASLDMTGYTCSHDPYVCSVFTITQHVIIAVNAICTQHLIQPYDFQELCSHSCCSSCTAIVIYTLPN